MVFLAAGAAFRRIDRFSCELVTDLFRSTAAALAGLGIVSSGLLGCAEELKNGTLLRVLGGWDIGSGDIHVILPAGRAAKPSARAFADFIASEFVDSTFSGQLSTGPTMSGD